MKRLNWTSLFVFALLLVLGIVGRFPFGGHPNFAPVAGIALFAGFYFRHIATGALLVVAVMTISNILLPAYHHPLELVVVYLALFFPVALREVVRRRFTALRVVSCSVLGGVVFYLSTNFVSWLVLSNGPGAMYPPNFEGLMMSYVAALPFFRATLCGDLFFSGLLFGGYALVTSWAPQEATATTGRELTA